MKQRYAQTEIDPLPHGANDVVLMPISQKQPQDKPVSNA
jgi:hypothetical protein